MKRELAFLLCLASALAFLSAGCATMNVAPEDMLFNVTMQPNYTAPSELICQGLNDSQPCYCMFCENRSSMLSGLAFLSDYFDATLEGGNCSFSHCNGTSFESAIEDGVLQIRTVAIGQGPSFTSAARANRYCNYSLQLATKWMKGIGAPPMVPNESRASCWLQRNVLPVYIYYTGGLYIDPARSEEIALEFARSPRAGVDNAGPVLITTELGLNSSNSSQIQAVKEQILRYQKCPNCLKVLAVRSNDTYALEQILEDPQTYYTGKNMSQMIDLVGFGFLANDYPDCSVERIVGENYAFSRYALARYSKPSIWLYAGASEGNNIDGTCSWDAARVHSFYQNIFGLVQGFASSGVVGASFYEFTDRMGPLPCSAPEGCGFGVVDLNGQKHPEMNTWSSLCRYYGGEQYRSPLVFSRNGQGDRCDFAQNTKMFNKLAAEINPPPSLLGSGQVAKSPVLHRGLNCGEVCVSNYPLSTLDQAIFDNSFGLSFDSAYCYEQSDDSEFYPELQEYADDSDISANYVRSLIARQDPFDQFAISCVNASNKTCNPDWLNMTQICAYAGNPPGCPDLIDNYCGPNPIDGSPQKVCAFGLSQCKEYPGGYYAAKGIPFPEEVRDCGGGNYYPFNPSMSICCGVKKLKKDLEAAKKFVNDPSNWMVLSDCTYPITETTRDWAYYYLASFLYGNESYNSTSKRYAGTLPSLDTFLLQRDSGGACHGEDSYIRYTRRFSNFSSGVMTLYLDALYTCQSDCAGRP